MCCHDSWTSRQTPTGWLSNVFSTFYKPQSLSNSCSQETMTSMSLAKVMQTSGDHDDRRSSTGYSFKVGFRGGGVSWETKKQQTVALSPCEAEDQGLAAAVQEATLLRSL